MSEFIDNEAQESKTFTSSQQEILLSLTVGEEFEALEEDAFEKEKLHVASKSVHFG